MTEFFLCFIPLIVAIDPVGAVPVFMALTSGADRARVRAVVVQSILTALAVSLSFLFLGKLVLRYLGVSVGDFMIAGGVLLFLISIADMINFGNKDIPRDIENIGAVPLGVPLVAGPALITTTMLLAGEYGYLMTMSATVCALLSTGVILLLARSLYHLMGKAGAKIVSKLANLLLASIAVMMVRKGIIVVLSEIR
jgi:multiple antibiotic resistance protein